MWTVSRFTVGMSAATNSTPLSMRFDTKATFRASRSSLAMTSTARRLRHASSAAASCGRSFLRPLSTSTNSPTMRPPTLATCCATADCCASKPSPERPC